MEKRSSGEALKKFRLSARTTTKILGIVSILAVSAYIVLNTLPPPDNVSMRVYTRVDCGEAHNASVPKAIKSAQATEIPPAAELGCDITTSIPVQVNGAGQERDPDVVSDAVASADAKHASEVTTTRRRSHNPNQSLSQMPSGELHGPDYTLEEICSFSGDDMLCRTETRASPRSNDVIGSDSSSSSDGTISGRVMGANGDALSGIMVVASPERLEDFTPDGDRTRRFWTRTDENGSYNFCKLPEGEYTIRSSRSGKFRSARTSARTGVDYADLIIPETSSLLASGRVVTPSGEPLEGVTVLPILAGQPSVRSDPTGRFSLPLALKDETGSLSIRFQQPGYSDSIVSFESIHNPRDLSAMEVVMQPVAAWTSVAGQVRTVSGFSLANKTVELRPVNSRQSYRSRTGQDGTFEFPVVEAPADYRLIVYGGAQHKDFEHLLQIHPQLGNIDVVVEPYDVGTLTGQLRNSNGEPVPNFELVLRNTGSREPVALVTTDGHGNFEVPSAPAGSLVISSRSTPHLLVQGLHIASDETQHTELTLDWGGHQIQGTVTDASGLPLPASQIILKWISISAEGISSSATRRTSSDSQGRFAFNSLGPGPHILKVSAAGYMPINLEHDLTRQGYEIDVRLEQTVSNRIERALARTETVVKQVKSNPAGSL